MDRKVTVLTPNGRRQVVKVSPNTTLLQILEEACQKHGFDSETHCLKHHNKEVGLSQTFRFSGLPNNCLLEMEETDRKRVSSTVDICIQLEDGSRKQGQFVPSDNLWHVLEQLSPEVAVAYASPVALYMRQEFIGKDRMMQTTLKSLGITEGRAMIRFIDKQPEELKTQANVYIAPAVVKNTTKDDDATPKRTTTAPGAGGFAITKELVQSLKKTTSDSEEGNRDQQQQGEEEKMDTSETEHHLEKAKYDWGTGSGRSMRDSAADVAAQAAAEQAEREKLEAEAAMAEPEVNVIGERNAILYSLDASQKEIEDLPDSFFDLTVHDLKLVLRDLKKISTGNEDAPLLTEKLRELEENKVMLNKIALYKNCVIRVQFPDRHVLQGMFKPIDRIGSVGDFVRKFLDNSTANFCLFTIPPKTTLPWEKTLLELNLVPNAVVHFAYDYEEGAPPVENSEVFIRAEFLDKLTSAEGALYAANKYRKENHKTANDAVNNNDDFIAPYEQRSPGPSTGAIPKRSRTNEETEQKI